MSAEAHGTKAIMAAFGANLGIAIAKFVGFGITGSGSMLAEAVHSLADTGNQALLLLGGHRAKQAPDPTHPFGFGRERYFWAFVVAVVLFTVGAVFAVMDGVSKLQHPHEIDGVGWAIGILTVAIILEGFSFRTAVHAARAESEPGTPLWQYIRESKSPEVPVVLLEDSAALIGLVVALSAVGISHVTGNAIWDGVGTVVIGVLLGVVAIVLAIEMKSLLIGESASPASRKAIFDAITGSPDVISIIHLRTEHLGPDDLLVATKVEFAHHLDYGQVASAIDRTEKAIRTAEPAARLIFVEPDVARADVDSPLSQP